MLLPNVLLIVEKIKSSIVVFRTLLFHMYSRAHCPARYASSTRSPHLLFTSSPLHLFILFTSSLLHLFILFLSSLLHSLHSLPHLPGAAPELCRASSNDPDIVIEFRCVVTVSTPAVWLARENIKRLTPRPCINVEYSHRVVYIEERRASSGRSGSP